MNEDFRISYSTRFFKILMLTSGYLLIFSLWILFQRAPAEIWKRWGIVSILLVMSPFLFVWIKSFRLEVTGKTLKYYSLLGGLKEIQLDEIKKVKYEQGSSKFMDKFRPPYRLVVRLNPEVGMKPFDINLFVFDYNDIRKLFSFLKGKF